MKPPTHAHARTIFLAFVALCFSLQSGACTMSSPEAEAETKIAYSKRHRMSDPSQYVPGQLLIKFKRDVTPALTTTLLQQHGAKIIRDYSELQLYLVALPNGIDVIEGINIFNQLDEIEFAEPNHIYKSED